MHLQISALFKQCIVYDQHGHRCRFADAVKEEGGGGVVKKEGGGRGGVVKEEEGRGAVKEKGRRWRSCQGLKRKESC